MPVRRPKPRGATSNLRRPSRDADGGRGRLPHRTDEISHRIVAPNFYEAVPTRPTPRLRKRGSRRWPVVFGRRGAPTKLPYVSAFVVR